MSVVNVHDFKTHYSKYLDQVARGKTVTVGKHGKAIATLAPIEKYVTPRKPGGMKGKIWVSDDFDEPMTWLNDRIANK